MPRVHYFGPGAAGLGVGPKRAGGAGGLNRKPADGLFRVLGGASGQDYGRNMGNIRQTPENPIISTIHFRGLIGLLVVGPFATLLRLMVSWMSVPYWMYFVVAGALGLLCILASLIAARPALQVDPGRVFRA